MNVGNVLIVLVSSFLMDRLGRRPLLLMSVGGMGCACLLLTAALVLGSNALVCAAVVRHTHAQSGPARSGPCDRLNSLGIPPACTGLQPSTPSAPERGALAAWVAVERLLHCDRALTRCSS